MIANTMATHAKANAPPRENDSMTADTTVIIPNISATVGMEVEWYGLESGRRSERLWPSEREFTEIRCRVHATRGAKPNTKKCAK